VAERYALGMLPRALFGLGCVLGLGMLAPAAVPPVPATSSPAPTPPAAQPAPAATGPADAPVPAGESAGGQASIDLRLPAIRGVDAAQIPPQIRLGLRAEVIRRQLPVVPVVVLVPDERSFVAAVAGWSLAARYPVLIDDGTWATREHVGRFVRAMGPGAKVVRFKAGEQSPWPDAGTPAEQQAALEAVVARTWGAREGESLVDALARYGGSPVGVVAASVTDPAWPAALALAAGRGQPLVFVSGTPGLSVSASMPFSDADRLSREITAGLGEKRLAWESLGEGVEAVTLALNVPTRVAYGAGDDPRLAGSPPFQSKPGESFALTDVIGRVPMGARSDRWAWAGQVFGSPAESAYRAMAGLFLAPSSAWFFNGYQSGPGWDQFNPAEAERVLSEQKWVVRSDGPPRQSAVQFRERAAGAWATRARAGASAPTGAAARGGLWASLIAVNTMGNADFFDLRPGRCLAADAPVLGEPSLVYFVHSWSAQQPENPATIAARFFRHGAFGYVGSVQEPLLQAFQPTPRFPLRMLSPAPLGVSARLDDAPMWRINVLADPLITWGPPAPVSKAALPLAGAAALEDELREQLKSKDFAAGLATLAMLGRDADAARLAGALLADAQVKVTPEIALAALGPVFRVVDAEAFVPLADLALLRADEHPLVRDLVWHALWPTITQLPEKSVDVLSRAVRPDALARDAEEAGRAIRRVRGPEAQRAFLDALIAKADAGGRRELEAVRSAAAQQR
jgi:hypothetical protein